MKNKQPNGLHTRREFFKKAIQKVLPILTAITLSNIPAYSKPTKNNLFCEWGCENGCVYECTGNCYLTCSGSCYASCAGSSDKKHNCSECNYSCTNTCKGNCTSCKGTCSTTCRANAQEHARILAHSVVPEAV